MAGVRGSLRNLMGKKTKKADLSDVPEKPAPGEGTQKLIPAELGKDAPHGVTVTTKKLEILAPQEKKQADAMIKDAEGKAKKKKKSDTLSLDDLAALEP